jgi:hypothetical protein
MLLKELKENMTKNTETNINAEIDILEYRPYIHKLLQQLKVPMSHFMYKDLEQTGFGALQKAKNTYDPSKSKFITHAYWLVIRDLQDELATMHSGIGLNRGTFLTEDAMPPVLSLDYSDDAKDLNLYDLIAATDESTTDHDLSLKIKLIDYLGGLELLTWLYDRTSRLNDEIRAILLIDYPELANATITKIKQLVKIRIKTKLKRAKKLQEFKIIFTNRNKAKMTTTQKLNKIRNRAVSYYYKHREKRRDIINERARISRQRKQLKQENQNEVV